MKLGYEQLGSQTQWPASYEGQRETLRHLHQQNFALQKECNRQLQPNNAIRETVWRLQQQLHSQWQILETLKVWPTSAVASNLLP